VRKKIVGIYQIQSKFKLDRIYIGSAVDITNRWNLHLWALKGNKHHSKKLQNHYNKYDKSDLQFSILLVCSKKDLIKFEQMFLDTYKPYFNIRTIANSSLGLKWTDKMRKENSGRRHTKEARAKISEGLKGNKNALGCKASEETKKKLRESKLGKKNPRYGTVPWNKGKTGVYSEEVLRNMSENKKGKLAWNKGMSRKEMKEYSKQINNAN